MRLALPSRKTAVRLLAGAIVVVAAVTATLHLPGYVVAAIAAVGALVPMAEQWYHERIGKRRGRTRTVGSWQRTELIGHLRDEVAAELTRSLQWKSGSTDGSTHLAGLRYWIKEISSVHPSEEVIDELTVEGLREKLEAVRQLAILGDGGTGKSTLLRMLQRRLLEVSERDEGKPIPILLDVSSWSEDDKDFRAWVAREIDISYNVPEHVSEGWVQSGRITFLFDSMDELRSQSRWHLARSLRAFLDSFDGLTMVACRSNEYAQISSELSMAARFELQSLERTEVQRVLDQALNFAPYNEELIDFAATPLKLALLVQTTASGAAVSGSRGQGPVDLTGLLSIYVRERLQGSTDNSDPAFSREEEQCLKWVAAKMREEGWTHLDPASIPYAWAPKNILIAVNIVVPAVLGLLAGVITLLWVSPAAAALVTCTVWLSYTTDTDMWFIRNRRLVLLACILAAFITVASLLILDTVSVAIGLTILVAWIYFSRHYAARYVVAAALANTVAMQGSDEIGRFLPQPVLLALASTLVWAVLLVLVATIIFTPCGASAKHHLVVEDVIDADIPARAVGSAIGRDAGVSAVAFFSIPVLATSIVCAFLRIEVGIGIAVIVAPICTLFMVHKTMKRTAQIIDHAMPPSIHYPLVTTIVVVPIVAVLGNAEETILSLPVLLALYLALCFVRGSDAGALRPKEGGAFVRQVVYRGLLAKADIIPFRFRRLLDRATRRLIMRRTGNKAYSFEHSLVRDYLAGANPRPRV